MEIEKGTLVNGGATITIDDITFSINGSGIISTQFTSGGSRLCAYQGYDSNALAAGTGNDSQANTLLNLFVTSYCSRQNLSTSSQQLGLGAQPGKDQVGEFLSGTFFNSYNSKWYFISAVITTVTPRTAQVCIFHI